MRAENGLTNESSPESILNGEGHSGVMRAIGLSRDLVRSKVPSIISFRLMEPYEQMVLVKLPSSYKALRDTGCQPRRGLLGQSCIWILPRRVEDRCQLRD